MATYASIADLVAYTDGLDMPVENSDEWNRITKIIDRAERQIDGVIMWGGDPDAANHRRVRVDELTEWDRQCLRLATCAQAEYRMLMGESFFQGGQYSRVEGPDFNTYGAMPVIGPRVWEELDTASYVLFHVRGVGRNGDELSYLDDEFLWQGF